jgi:hypothetical protein
MKYWCPLKIRVRVSIIFNNQIESNYNKLKLDYRKLESNSNFLESNSNSIYLCIL